MRSLKSYLPAPPDDLDKIVNVRVPIEIAQRVKAIAKRNKWTSSDVVRAGLYKFLDEDKEEEQMDFLIRAQVG